MKMNDDLLDDPGKPDPALLYLLLEREEAKKTQIIDMMTHQVFSNTSFIPFSAIHEQELFRRLSIDKKRPRKRRRIIWWSLSLVFLALSVYFLSKSSSENPKEKITIHDKKGFSSSILPSIEKASIQEPDQPEEKSIIPIAAIPDTLQEDSTQRLSITETKSGVTASLAARMHIPEDIVYEDEIPILNEQEITRTKKDKQKMIRDIVRKKTYFKMPMGYTVIEGKRESFQSFSMKYTEVTNLEYRTFLNDLLIQGKVDDYLQARPVSNGWKKAGIEKNLDEYYFSAAQFDDYPAVNMNRRGAELYCVWLTSSLREAITKGEVKWTEKNQPKFRLPYENEWIYAARSCDTIPVNYPWKISESVQNQRGCYLCNFNCRISQDQFQPLESVQQKKKGNTAGSSSECAMDTLITTRVYSYLPNDKGLYCMSGNISEMVWACDSTNLPTVAKSMGGSWNSSAQQVKIEATERYTAVTEGRAYIGFRPVLIW